MNSKIKTLLLIALTALSLSTSNVSYAASLSVCGETKPAPGAGTATPYDNYADYQTFLVKQNALLAGNAINQDQYNAADSDYKNAHGICQTKDLFRQIARIINFLMGFIGVFVIIKIVMSGFQMVTSQGNAEGVRNAKAGITNALIGLVLVFAAFLLANIIFQAAGVGGFNINPFGK
ncbi:MAG: hypothetical protein NVSMB66_3460 [Candidatus Doudnabacteria bacterium]